MPKKLTKEEFIERAKQIHGDRYDYSKINYVNANTKICIICPEHGEFWQRPHDHLEKHGCRKCGKNNSSIKKTLTREEFIEKAKHIHDNKYDYSKVEYINNSTKVCIICPKHGEFWIKPNDLLNNHNCSKCKSVYKYTTEEWIEKVKKIHGEKFNYSKSKYVNSRTKILIGCNKCQNYFYVTSINHLHNKSGCPYCISSKLEEESFNILNGLNIKYERKKHFDWLRNKYLLELDFYLPDYGIAIECQGIQHFEPTTFGGINIEKAKENLIYLQNNDKIKKELCEKNGIKLYYINYNENLKEKLLKIIKNEKLGNKRNNR